MIHGEVVRMRLNPEELMACADVIKASGVQVDNMSLSLMCRVALMILVRSAMEQGQIEKRDGFDYSRIIEPYKRAPAKIRVRVAHTLNLAEMQRAALDMPTQLGVLPLKQAPLAVTEEDKARSRTAVEQALQADGQSDEQIARTLGKKNVRARVDPRKLRFDELRFKSEQSPENMEAREFKELRKLGRELGESVAAQSA